jgi:chromosome partitioning protein
MSREGRRVLLVDFDPQGNASSGLAVEKKKLDKSMTDVMMGTAKMADVILKASNFKNFSIAPTTAQLANAEVEIGKMNKRFVRLKTAIESVEQNYDYVIIDSPPALSLLTVNGLIAADYLILPVQTEFYALEGVSQLLESMKLVKKAMNPELKLLGVVATMFDKRTVLSGQVLAEIKKYFRDKVFETVIPRNVRLAEAPSHGVPVGVYDRFSKGAKAYKALTREVLGRM